MNNYEVRVNGQENVEVSKYSVTNDGYEGNITSRIKFEIQANGKPGKEMVVDASSVQDNRDGWGNKIEFLLAIIGYAVGLGNVWRFPYLAQKNGGGAFLIPYILSLALMGIPVFLLELVVGQRLRKGPLHAWSHFSPYLSGVGISSVIVSFLVGCYYNMIVAWCFYYLFISFQKNVPYTECPCVGGSCTDTNNTYVEECKISSSTTYFWYRSVLNVSDNIDDGGVFNYKLALCLVLAWIVVYLITFKGVKSMGKVVYFTALFPYIVLIIFFIRMLMLKGSYDGIIHMFKPQFDKLQKQETWLDAASQIFYSLGLAFGGLLSMSSYNDVHNNVIRDALMVSCINCGTSVFAGIVIFGILGYKATINYENCLAGGNNTSCDLTIFLNEVAEGPGLTFIAFTEAMSTMDLTPLWSFLFFTMLLTLGLGSMIGTIEGVRTTVIDLKLIPLRKELVHLIICVISLGFGMLFCQGSGEYWLQMFDSYSAGIGLLTIALFEIIIVVYIYGMDKLEEDMEYMLGIRPNWYWKGTWYFVTPILIVTILIATLYGLFANSITYDAWSSSLGKIQKSEFPGWGVALCFILIFSSIVVIPLTCIMVHFKIFRIPGGIEPGSRSKEMTALPVVRSTVALTEYQD